MNHILQTQRLYLRKFTAEDLPLLYQMLSDPITMHFYPKVENKEGSQKWLNGILKNYEKVGFSFWAAHLKKTEEFVGQVGPLRQEIDGNWEIEIGYMFNRKHWRNGYATESAKTCRDYAFRELNANRVMSMIRPENIASSGVARNNNMQVLKTVEWHNLKHDIWCITREEWEKRTFNC